MHTQVRDIVLCAGKCYANHKKATECCVTHTQGTHIGGKSIVSGGVEWVLCAHTRYTHRRGECCVWRCGGGVVCTHKEC